MVGICAAFGDRDHEFTSLSAVDAQLRLTGEELREDYRDDGAEVAVAVHPFFADDQPARLADGCLLWIWGDVRGYDAEDGYRSRADATGTAGLCAELYDRHGIDFLDRLNGEFVGLVYDPEAATVRIFTDRMGTRPIYLARGEDGELLVSTQLQLFAAYPGFEVAFEEEFLCEYLTYRRAFGVETPLAGVRQAPPSAVVEYDVETGESTTSEYWYPAYDPVERSYDAFVEEFVERFRAALDDCLADGVDHGLMLSGGSDSRLMLRTLEDLGTEVASFHYTDWADSRETRTARRVADVVGSEFHTLEQDGAYFERLLSEAPGIQTFNGSFESGYKTAFGEAVADDVDLVLYGLWSDTLFKQDAMALRTASPFGREVELPFEETVDSAAAYVEWLAEPVPRYVRGYGTTGPILAANVHDRGSEVVHHGVSYRSAADLLRLDGCYPFTDNYAYFHYEGAIKIMPHRTPFVDRRLIDLYLSMPSRFQARRNVVHDAVEAVEPALAAIPHGSSRLPLSYPYLAHWAVEEVPGLRWLRDRIRPSETPAPHVSNGPWPDYDNVLRETEFGETAVADARDAIEAMPWVDETAVRPALEEETGNWRTFNALLTLANMPVTSAVLEADEPVVPAERAATGGVVPDGR